MLEPTDPPEVRRLRSEILESEVLVRALRKTMLDLARANADMRLASNILKVVEANLAHRRTQLGLILRRTGDDVRPLPTEIGEATDPGAPRDHR